MSHEEFEAKLKEIALDENLQGKAWEQAIDTTVRQYMEERGMGPYRGIKCLPGTPGGGIRFEARSQ